MTHDEVEQMLAEYGFDEQAAEAGERNAVATFERWSNDLHSLAGDAVVLRRYGVKCTIVPASDGWRLEGVRG